jgi:hypothetical protein
MARIKRSGAQERSHNSSIVVISSEETDMKYIAIALGVLFGSFSFALAQSNAAGSAANQNPTNAPNAQGSAAANSASGSAAQPPTNSSQADYNASLKDGSAPGSSPATQGSSGANTRR